VEKQELPNAVSDVLIKFAEWLDSYGETSWDFQTLYSGPIGGRAKALYYQNRIIGTAAVAPIVFFEAFLPAARRLFYRRLRFPIADAHYAMGFCFLYQFTSDPAYFERATHFLDVLKRTRCNQFQEYCWGYPFDWVCQCGVIKKQTPLITTTPYVYEAFLHADQIVSQNGADVDYFNGTTSDELKSILESIARHAFIDIKDIPTSEASSTCTYTPFGESGVINAAAYRSFLLTSASQLFSKDEYWAKAERNLNFIFENQNSDGSWPYAVDGVRDFVDHFHTCFVLKALAKIYALTGYEACGTAIVKGINYYLNNLLAPDGLPKPFAKAPRLTVYKRELYDCAECINLCLLLRDRFPQLQSTLETVIQGILKEWVKPDGSFRSRRLYLGWDNVPMHRWGESQMFRSLAFYLVETKKAEQVKPKTEKDKAVEAGV